MNGVQIKKFNPFHPAFEPSFNSFSKAKHIVKTEFMRGHEKSTFVVYYYEKGQRPTIDSDTEVYYADGKPYMVSINNVMYEVGI